MEKKKSRFAVFDLRRLEVERPNLHQILEDARREWERDIFILQPEIDPAALGALLAYADNAKTPTVARWLKDWANKIKGKGSSAGAEPDGNVALGKVIKRGPIRAGW